MAVFVVLLKAPNQAVRNRIKTEFSDEDRLEFSPMTFFVSSSKLAEEVAQTVGLKGEDRIQTASGAVFRLSSAYSGYTSRNLWEWLRAHEDAL